MEEREEEKVGDSKGKKSWSEPVARRGTAASWIPPNHSSVCLVAQRLPCYSRQDACQHVLRAGKMQTADGRPSVSLWELKGASQGYSRISQTLSPVPLSKLTTPGRCLTQSPRLWRDTVRE